MRLTIIGMLTLMIVLIVGCGGSTGGDDPNAGVVTNDPSQPPAFPSGGEDLDINTDAVEQPVEPIAPPPAPPSIPLE